MKKQKKWITLEEKDVSPSTWFPVFRQKVRLPNNKIIDDFYISKMKNIVVGITKKKQIVLVQEYRQANQLFTLELPGGYIEKGKSRRQAAIDEFEEETGFVAKKIHPLGYVFPQPNKLKQKAFGFLIYDLRERKKQTLDETEDITVKLVPTSKIENKIKNGDIVAAETVALLAIAKLKHPKLFE